MKHTVRITLMVLRIETVSRCLKAIQEVIIIVICYNIVTLQLLVSLSILVNRPTLQTQKRFFAIIYFLVRQSIDLRIHKGRPQRRGWGMVKCGHLQAGGGVKDLANVRQMTLLKNCFSMLCRHSLWVMVINPFTGQDVYRRPKLAAFPMGRTCISVLTGLAVSDTKKPRYLVL